MRSHINDLQTEIQGLKVESRIKVILWDLQACLESQFVFQILKIMLKNFSPNQCMIITDLEQMTRRH